MATVRRGPADPRAAQAKSRIERLEFDAAARENTVAGYAAFPSRHREGDLAAHARTRTENIHWRRVTASNTVAAYNTFRAMYPTSHRSGEALTRHEEAAWAEARSKDTVDGYAGYSVAVPAGAVTRNAAEAAWAAVVQAQTRMAYAEYARRFSKGAHVGVHGLEELAETVWTAAVAGRRLELYREYLRVLPSGAHAADARDAVAWSEVGEQATPQTVRSYLTQQPDGRCRDLAATWLQALEVPAPVAPTIEAMLPTLVDGARARVRDSYGATAANAITALRIDFHRPDPDAPPPSLRDVFMGGGRGITIAGRQDASGAWEQVTAHVDLDVSASVRFQDRAVKLFPSGAVIWRRWGEPPVVSEDTRVALDGIIYRWHDGSWQGIGPTKRVFDQ